MGFKKRGEIWALKPWEFLCCGREVEKAPFMGPLFKGDGGLKLLKEDLEELYSSEKKLDIFRCWVWIWADIFMVC